MEHESVMYQFVTQTGCKRSYRDVSSNSCSNYKSDVTVKCRRQQLASGSDILEYLDIKKAKKMYPLLQMPVNWGI